MPIEFFMETKELKILEFPNKEKSMIRFNLNSNKLTIIVHSKILINRKDKWLPIVINIFNNLPAVSKVYRSVNYRKTIRDIFSAKLTSNSKKEFITLKYNNGNVEWILE